MWRLRGRPVRVPDRGAAGRGGLRLRRGDRADREHRRQARLPALRPPFPANAGLWGRPTVINNVETLAKVPSIIMHGARWYNALGTPESAGTKLFAVSGSVVRPGVYEVPFGVPLRHLIYDLAGGLAAGGRCGPCSPAAWRAHSSRPSIWTRR